MPKVIKNRFAEILARKNRRDKTYYTRREIERLTGISRKTIDRYYNNAGETYNMNVVAVLCEFLEVTVNEFFEESEPDDSPQFKTPLLATA